MDSFLEFIPFPDSSEEDDKKVDLWLEEQGKYTPSQFLTTTTNISPGLYQVLAKQNEVYALKKPLIYDELYKFDNTANDLFKEITNFWNQAEKYKNANIVHKRGILLAGPPGGGKTSIINLICDELINNGGVIFQISGDENLDLTVNFLQNKFRKIEPNTPIITIIEDIDKYEWEDVMLDFLDGKTSINHHVVIATSNITEDIPEAYLRPSRIDTIVEINPPCDSIKEQFLIKKGVSQEDAKKIAKNTSNLSFADLKEIFVKVYLLNYPLEGVINKVKSPIKKKNYLTSNKSSLGFNNI